MSHLPDPVLGEANEGHYQKCSNAFGTESTEIHFPFAKLNEQKNTIDFAALKEHAFNANLTIICTEYVKPQLV